jgi:hypothetical protein
VELAPGELSPIPTEPHLWGLLPDSRSPGPQEFASPPLDLILGDNAPIDLSCRQLSAMKRSIAVY